MQDRPDPRGPARPPANPDRPFPVRYALCYTPRAGFHPPARRVWREASCTDLREISATIPEGGLPARRIVDPPLPALSV